MTFLKKIDAASLFGGSILFLSFLGSIIASNYFEMAMIAATKRFEDSNITLCCYPGPCFTFGEMISQEYSFIAGWSFLFVIFCFWRYYLRNRSLKYRTPIYFSIVNLFILSVIVWFSSSALAWKNPEQLENFYATTYKALLMNSIIFDRIVLLSVSLLIAIEFSNLVVSISSNLRKNIDSNTFA